MNVSTNATLTDGRGGCSFCGKPKAFIASTEFDSFVRTGIVRSFCSTPCGKAYRGSLKQAQDNYNLALGDAARANADAVRWKAEIQRREGRKPYPSETQPKELP